MKDISGFRGEFAFLSNFHPCRIVMGGVEFPTVEHAYQAAKTLEPVQRDFIRRAPTPGEAKRRGRAIKVRGDWDKVKFDLMLKLLKEKFKDPVLAGKLLETGDARIVEENAWKDTTWGMVRRSDGELVGQNFLGKFLETVRAELVAKRDLDAIAILAKELDLKKEKEEA